jgi:hypothetical protein
VDFDSAIRRFDPSRPSHFFIIAEQQTRPRIKLRAWSRSKKGDDGDRAIGIRRFPITQITPNQEIHGALKKKASRYGELDHPYLVAINALATFQREEAVIDALLGPYVKITRLPDGQGIVGDRMEIWYGPPDGQPQNTRMSGVLSFMQLDPWNFAAGMDCSYQIRGQQSRCLP